MQGTVARHTDSSRITAETANADIQTCTPLGRVANRSGSVADLQCAGKRDRAGLDVNAAAVAGCGVVPNIYRGTRCNIKGTFVHVDTAAVRFRRVVVDIVSVGVQRTVVDVDTAAIGGRCVVIDLVGTEGQRTAVDVDTAAVGRRVTHCFIGVADLYGTCQRPSGTRGVDAAAVAACRVGVDAHIARGIEGTAAVIHTCAMACRRVIADVDVVASCYSRRKA